MSIDPTFMANIARCDRKTSANGKECLRLSVGVGDSAQWVSVMAFDPEAITMADC